MQSKTSSVTNKKSLLPVLTMTSLSKMDTVAQLKIMNNEATKQPELVEQYIKKNWQNATKGSTFTKQAQEAVTQRLSKGN